MIWINGQRTVKNLKDMPRDFIPCKAPDCNRWYNRHNVVRKGYCDKHKYLVTDTERQIK